MESGVEREKESETARENDGRGGKESCNFSTLRSPRASRSAAQGLGPRPRYIENVFY